MPCVSEIDSRSGNQAYDLRTAGRAELGSAFSVVKEVEFFRQLFRETRSSSEFLERQRRFQFLEKSLLGLMSLAQGWDSYDSEPPSSLATSLASAFLSKLCAESLLPSSIVPSAEGGTALNFVRGDRNAYAEFRNSGELIIALYDHKLEPMVAELSSSDADETRAIELLRRYFR
jgi:hypothetical protein